MRDAATDLSPGSAPPEPVADGILPRALAVIYERHFDFVWRNARRLGVHEPALDDVVQEVFLIVCRRLPEFESRSSVQTWLFGIVSNVVSRQRRTATRRFNKLPPGDADGIPEVPALDDPSPLDVAMTRQAVDVLYELLARLDEAKRTAFIMIELEQRAPAEVAEALGVNVNTIHSRLRAARQQIEVGIARHREREKWSGG